MWFMVKLIEEYRITKSTNFRKCDKKIIAVFIYDAFLLIFLTEEIFSLQDSNSILPSEQQ